MSYEFVSYGRLQLPFSVKIVLFNYDGGGRIAAKAFVIQVEPSLMSDCGTEIALKD